MKGIATTLNVFSKPTDAEEEKAESVISRLEAKIAQKNAQRRGRKSVQIESIQKRTRAMTSDSAFIGSGALVYL
jgi:hypothetical protein